MALWFQPEFQPARGVTEDVHRIIGQDAVVIDAPLGGCSPPPATYRAQGVCKSGPKRGPQSPECKIGMIRGHLDCWGPISVGYYFDKFRREYAVPFG